MRDTQKVCRERQLIKRSLDHFIFLSLFNINQDEQFSHSGIPASAAEDCRQVKKYDVLF